MKKRILSIALVVVMIVAMIPAMLLPTAAVMFEDGYDAAIVTDGAITVDGTETPDAAYLNGEKIISRNHNVTGNANGETNEFVAYAAADDNGLYVWAKITDQSLNKGDGYTDKVVDPGTGIETEVDKFASASQGDKFQLYIRASSDAGRAYGTYEMDYINQIAASAAYGLFDKDSMTRAINTYPENNVWVVETYIPWTTLAAEFEGQTTDDIQIQLGVQTCNYDYNWVTTEKDGVSTTSLKNTAKAYSYDNRFGGSYYRGMYGHTYATGDNGSGWMGSLCTPLNFSGLDVAVVADAIAVDGKMDAAYAKSEEVGCYIGNGASENYKAYAVASIDGLYVYVDIIDDTLDKKAFEYVGMGDKFQLYFQMGNRYTQHYWGYIEMDYRSTEECLNEGNAKNFRFASKSSWYGNDPVEADIQRATTKKIDAQGNELGWTAELFIPWAGGMKERNIDDLTTQSVALGFQVNNYALKEANSTVDTYTGKDDNYSCICYCLSNRDGGKYWLGNDGSGGNISGSYFFTPVRFVFDNAPQRIERWAKYVDAITLDGKKDENYSEYAVDYVDVVYVSGSQGATETLTGGWHYGDFIIGKAYYAFTDTDMYVYFEVYDDTVAPDGSTNEYACIYYNTSNFAGKWNLGPDQSYNTNSNYWGTATYPAIDPETLSNGQNLALSYYKKDGTAGTKTDYDSYAVEFKLPLPEGEKAALAAGEAITIGIGLETNDAKELVEGDERKNGKRQWYGYSAANAGNWYGGYSNTNDASASMPRVRLDKNLTDAPFTVTPEITGAQVALGESINMNYFATLPLNATNAKMKFTFNGEEFFANAAVTDVANEYMFVFEGIAPQCMKDNIKAELIVDGEVVATKDNYSVWQNTFDIWAKDSSNQKLTSLVGDLWAYGAAAQKYAGYKTDDLINQGYTHLATPVNSIADDKTLTQGELITFKAAGVYFDNINKLYAKVIIPAEALEMDGFAITLDGAPVAFEATGNEDEYIIYTGDILVTEFDEYFTFVVTDGTDTATLKYSVNAYCKAKLNAEKEATAALAAATYAYGASAEAYQG